MPALRDRNQRNGNKLGQLHKAKAPARGRGCGAGAMRRAIGLDKIEESFIVVLMASTSQKQLPDRVLEHNQLGKIRLSVASYRPRSKHQKFRLELEAIGQFNKINSDSWWTLYRIGAGFNGAVRDGYVMPKPDSERTLLSLFYADSAAAEAAFNQMVLWLSE